MVYNAYARRCVAIAAFVTSVCGCYAPARMADWERLSRDLHVSQRQADLVDLSALAGGSYASVPGPMARTTSALHVQHKMSLAQVPARPLYVALGYVRPGRLFWHYVWLIGLMRQE